ncbi:MAG: AsmA-like C-terminal region-containing protein [Candidatus Acidiferrales bacterium]
MSETALRAEPFKEARSRQSAWIRWPKWILLLLFSIWVADTAISLLIQHSRLNRKLTARLEAAFGRPVEVGSYDFSLWGGPTLEARSVTVGEDLRFGHEYFLRAESLTMRLRWQSLLLARLELGTLSLSRPSLNLDRNADGNWNLAEWLPRPAGNSAPGAATIGPPAPEHALYFRRIEVDSGRINFKRGDEKLPFAFVSVRGYVEPEGPGRWRMDLEAIPSRTAVIAQQAGMLHLVGHVGGTSSRLRPAALELSWRNASISDVLRLTRSYDYGVRGTLGLSISARTEGDAWILDGRTELGQLHRWDLPARGDNPSVNLIAKGKLDLGPSRFDLTEATLEAPHSNAHAEGGIEWGRVPVLKREALGPELRLTSSTVALSDVFAWYRAFHSDVADDLTLEGSSNFDGTLRGWPPHIDEGTLTMEGVQLTGPRLPQTVKLNPTQIRFLPEGIRMKSTTIVFGDPGVRPIGTIFLDESLEPVRKGTSNLRVVGMFPQVRDVLSTASALGWNLSRGWDFAGSVGAEFVWLGARYPWQTETNGTVVWGGYNAGSVRAPFMNQPVEQIKAVVSIRMGTTHISISSAEAFGARWRGSLDRSNPPSGWQFSLSADRIAAADLDRWLNPRWGQSLLDRMLPFLNPRSPANAVPETLRANGRISVDQFTLAPLIVRRLQGNLKIEGRRLKLLDSRGQFYGGNIGGSLDAELDATPAYHVSFDFSDVDLHALTAPAPGLANQFAGSATGEISFDARGATRGDMVASAECHGAARVSQAEIRNMNLAESLREAARRHGTSSFRQVTATFHCADSKVNFQDLSLLGTNVEIHGAGSVDFGRNLDLRLQIRSGAAESKEAYQLTGPLADPSIARLNTPAPRR